MICQLMGIDHICLCLHSNMEIDFNKEERTEMSEKFVHFSIREYVAGIRKKDRKKCWPFGSLGDPDNDDLYASYQFPECRLISSKICPHNIDHSDSTPKHIEAPPNYRIESPGLIEGKTIYDGKVNNNARFLHENSIDEDAKIGTMVAADGNDERVGRNQPRKKAQKFLLLSDILRDLAGPCGGYHVRCNIVNPDNVNGRFVTESEDESDDITLKAFFRKQKGVEVNKIKKKRKMVRVEESRIDRDKKLERGSKHSNENDLDVGPRKEKDRVIENRHAKVCSTTPTKTANEDSEMEAVMLLASHFNEENPQRPTNGAKNAQMVQSGMKTKAETELLEITKHIGNSSPSSYKRKSNHDQRLFEINANISNDPKMVCACVKKKIRKSSIRDGNYESVRSLKTITKDRDFYGNTHRKYFQEKTEKRKMNSGRVEWDAEKRVKLVCSINRNPADFSIANSENEFMRGG